MTSKATDYALLGSAADPPDHRSRCARLRVGLTVAEYFRDEEGQGVLLFIDNIFRFTQAGSEVFALRAPCRCAITRTAAFLSCRRASSVSIYTSILAEPVRCRRRSPIPKLRARAPRRG